VRFHPDAAGTPEYQEVCRIFHLKPGLKKYLITQDTVEPFGENLPPEGLDKFDLDPRSLLQALFYLCHAVCVPPEHVAKGIVVQATYPDGEAYDYGPIFEGLFKVCSVKSCFPPKNAFVAVKYLDYWFYIDNADTDSKTTLALVLAMSQLELGAKTGQAPVLTLPVGGR
jgi:hypothetical protein